MFKIFEYFKIFKYFKIFEIFQDISNILNFSKISWKFNLNFSEFLCLPVCFSLSDHFLVILVLYFTIFFVKSGGQVCVF